jgi:hypothetical protein
MWRSDPVLAKTKTKLLQKFNHLVKHMKHKTLLSQKEVKIEAGLIKKW